ncbi:patatin-like phospholipase family protein [Klebsiella variicola]|uniref:patatin-like phospholipase family protein n=1 Tax=Klebsiella variicola TaxID=244366 RepID=UPI00224FAA12|nr:patatin-like phospholipase family protein [Klebsiella variicola]
MTPRKPYRYLAVLLVASLLVACCGAERPSRSHLSGSLLKEDHLQNPGAAPFAPVISRPQVALVLGGGGLRGYAHIGVLQALEKAGIRPDIVVGTSIGSIIGAAYAAGNPPDQIWHMATTLQVLSLADLNISGPGFVRGDALARWADKMAGGKKIEHFPVRFAAVATEMNLLLPYVITAGVAGQGLRASAAIPGVFLPVETGGLTLVDGGVSALVPVRAARALGADVVIAVDIYCHGQQYPMTSALSMLLRVSQAQTCQLARPEADSADVLITPVVKPAGINDTEGRETARLQGYRALLEKLPLIRSVLQHVRRSAKDTLPAPHGAFSK